MVIIHPKLFIKIPISKYWFIIVTFKQCCNKSPSTLSMHICPIISFTCLFNSFLLHVYRARHYLRYWGNMNNTDKVPHEIHSLARKQKTEKLILSGVTGCEGKYSREWSEKARAGQGMLFKQSGQGSAPKDMTSARRSGSCLESQHFGRPSKGIAWAQFTSLGNTVRTHLYNKFKN